MSVSSNPTPAPAQPQAQAESSSSGLHGGSAQWQPPIPSMAALPVDMSKTEPKPAYYKLQFGDDYTGFSYYVRTLGIVIGRKCEKPIQVPPPDIMSPQVPARPPLDSRGLDEELPDVQRRRDGEEGIQGMSFGEGLGEMAQDLFSGELGQGVDVGNTTMADASVAGPSHLDASREPLVNGSATPELAPQPSSSNPASSSSNPPPAEGQPSNGQMSLEEMQQVLTAEHPQFYANGLPNGEYGLDLDLDLDVASDAAIIHFMLNGSGPSEGDGPPPPPPPPPKASSVEHVDVDLGPLKSVSRNHAKIDFRPDLGHFCLEIHGRNGAWVDDRYYVKGSAVPLYQGSVIQIATRIFSFILPPSPGGSPTTPHVLDASFDSNSPLDDVPYPYNLPASQVGYQEFFGESTAAAGPGPTTISQQVPQPFNAFTAPDGQGLGLGMEYDWSQDKRKGRHHWTEEWSSEDSEDSWDSWDESDEVEERKIHRRRRRVRKIDEGESELSSIEDGSEEEEEEDEEDDDEDEDEEEEEEAPVPDDPVKDDPMLDEPEKPKKRGRPKTVKPAEQAATPPVVVKEEVDVPVVVKGPGKAPAQSGKLPSKSVKAVKALKAQVAKKNQVAGGDVVMGDQSNVAEAEVKKVKKAKVDTPVVVKPVEEGPKEKDKPEKEKEKEKEKPKPPPKKAAPKKVKAAPPPPPPKLPSVPGVLIPGLSVQVTPPPPRPVPPPPPPTLAAAMAAATPAPPPQPRPPPPTAVRPPPTAGRPPMPPAPVQQPNQAVRPPIRPPIRPPMPGAGQPIRPPLPLPPSIRPPGIRPPPPGHIITQPPITPRPVPVHAVSASAQSTAASSPGGTPEPQKPFYLTELIETPGRPGHIIVNVPIPPSGAGPRPPPGPLIGLDGENFIGPPPIKPTATFAIIIYSALANLQRGRGTLGEVCNWIAGEWEWFRLNVDTGWQNSIRHNLSLNKAFLKVPRIPEDDPESKGSVWIIDPKEGPIFEEKQRKESHKSEGKTRTAEMRAVRERQKIDERTKMVKDGLVPPPLTPPPVPAVHAPLPRPPPPRVTAPLVRPTPRPPPVASIPKGPVLPKEKVAVSFDTITPAMRAESLIQTLDSNGNPLPFVCSNTALVLERSAFGHLTPDIIEKLHLLGAHVAVEVLLSWVNNKNKQQLAKAAQAKAASNAAGASSSAPAVRPAARPNVMAKQARPPPRPPASAPARPPPPAIAPARPPAAPPAAVRPPISAPPPRPPANAPPARPPLPTSTSNTKPPAPVAPKPAPAAGPPKPGASLGPAPPGATMTKIITMIATVAAANGDVKTVGQHAVALLRYIKMVGAAIDLKAAERIWATGIVPPLNKGAPGAGMVNGGKPNGVNGGVAGGVKKPGVAGGLSPGMAPKGQLRPSPGPPSAGGRTPTSAPQSLAPTPVARTAALPSPGITPQPIPGSSVGVGGAVKRKLEEGEGSGPRPVVGGEMSEAKRPKLEAGGS